MATDLTDLKGSVNVSLRLTATKAGDLSSPNDPLSKAINTAFTFGTGEDQINQLWSDSRSLAGAASESLDLSGVLTNAFGVTCQFSKVKAILIHNISDDAAAILEVGGAAAAQVPLFFKHTSDIILVNQGAYFLACDPVTGYTVTGTTADILKMLNASADKTLTYEIVIAGLSA